MRTLGLLSSVLSLSIGAITTANASGYAINVNSTTTQGRAGAGRAVTEDILAMYNNPAILSQMKSHYEIAISGTGLLPNVKYNDYIATNNTGNVARNKFTGSLAVAAKIHPCVTLGLSVSTPYGLAFSYPHASTSPVANNVVESELKAVAISPTIAFKVNPMLTLGVGVDAQWTDVRLSNYPVAALPTTYGTAKGNNWVARGTFGVLVDATKDIRLGASVKTRSIARLKGDYTVENPQASFGLVSGKAKADLPLPTTLTFGGSYNLCPQWTLYADYTRTNWSTVNNVTLTVPVGSSSIVGGWEDSNAFSLGADYKFNDNWTLRGGFGFDFTPTTTQAQNGVSSRVPGIPDSNKKWLAIGGSYEIKNIKISLSYGHEFFKNAPIQQAATYTTIPGIGTVPVSRALNGQIKESVDLVSLQLNYKF